MLQFSRHLFIEKIIRALAQLGNYCDPLLAVRNKALAQTHIKEKQLKAPFQSAHEYKENNRISKIHDDTQTNKRENEKKDKDEINEARGHTNEGTIGSGGDK